MFAFDPSLVTYWVESHVHMGELSLRKSLLTPGKGVPHSWLPNGYVTDFEDLAIRQNLANADPDEVIADLNRPEAAALVADPFPARCFDPRGRRGWPPPACAPCPCGRRWEHAGEGLPVEGGCQ